MSSDSEKTHQISPLNVDSSPNDHKSAPALSSSSPLWDKSGHASSPSDPSFPCKDSSGDEIKARQGPEAAQEVTFPDRLPLSLLAHRWHQRFHRNSSRFSSLLKNRETRLVANLPCFNSWFFISKLILDKLLNNQLLPS